MKGAQRLVDKTGTYLYRGDRVQTSCQGREVEGEVLGMSHAWVLVRHDKVKGGTHTIQVRPWELKAV